MADAIRTSKRRTNSLPNFIPGQRIGQGVSPHGGGGPENVGAHPSTSVAIPFYQAQPSWRWEENQLSEYTGYAAASTTPMLAGIPADNFRGLGDDHRGRQ